MERNQEAKPRQPPDDGSYQAAVRGLIDRKWLKSQAYKDWWSATDLSHAHPDLADFLGRLRRRTARMGIPVRVEGRETLYDVAYVVHSNLGRQLTAKQWEVLAHLGREISRQYSLNVGWGGHMMPATWLHSTRSPVPGL